MTTTYSVGLEFKSTAGSESTLRRLEQRLGGIEAKLKEQKRGAPPFKKVGDSAARAQGKVEGLGNSIARFKRELRGADAGVGRLGGALRGLERTRLGGLTAGLQEIVSLGPRAAGAFAAVGAAIGTTILAVRELGRAYGVAAKEAEAFRRVSTLTSDIGQVQAEIRQVVAATGNLTTVAEAAASTYEILSAGFTETGAAAKVLGPTLQLATGGFATTKEAADLLTTALNSYGIEADRAAEVSSKLIETQNAGKVVIPELARSLGQVTGIAAGAGVSLDELLASVASLTALGQRPESAIAGLRGAIVKIVAPTKQGKDAAEAFGVTLGQAAIDAKGFEGVLREIFEATNGNQQALRLFFEDVEALNAVATQGNNDFQKYGEALERIGGATTEAADAANKAVDPVQQLSNAINGLRGRIGQPLKQAIDSAARALTPLIQGFSRLLDLMQPLGQALISTQDFFKGLAQTVATVLGPFAQLASIIERIIGLRSSLADAIGQVGRINTPSVQQRTSAAVAAESQAGPFSPRSVSGGDPFGLDPFGVGLNRAGGLTGQKPQVEVEVAPAVDAEKEREVSKILEGLSGGSKQQAERASRDRVANRRNEALEQARQQQQLAQGQFRLDEQISDNRIRLRQAEFEAETRNLRDAAALRQRLDRSRQRSISSGLVGPAASSFDAFSAFANARQGRADEITNLRRDITGMSERLKDLTSRLDLAKTAPVQAQLTGIPGAGGGSGLSTLMGVPGISEYLTGDRSSPAYDPPHGGGNYHEHIGTTSKGVRDQLTRGLESRGIYVGSRNDGRHSPNSLHYADRAIDIPAYPNLGRMGLPDNRTGEEALSQRVRDAVSEILGGGAGGGAGGVMSDTTLGEMTKAGRIVQLESEIRNLEVQIDSTSQKLQGLLGAQGTLNADDAQTAINNVTSLFREQAESLNLGNEQLAQRNELLRGRAGPEALEASAALAAVTREYTLAMEGLDQVLAENPELTDQVTAAQQKLTEGYNKLKESIGQQEQLQLVNRQLEESIVIAKSIEDALASGVGNAIQGLIDGTKDLNDVLKETLASIGQILVQATLSRLFQGVIPGELFTGITRRASGGNLTAGKPYLVGENGPELFSPGQSGSISNNRSAFGELRDTLGTFGTGAPDLSDTMPEMAAISYNGPILNFNSEEFVSKEQIPRIVDQATKQAYGYAMSKLRTRPTDRRGLGL